MTATNLGSIGNYPCSQATALAGDFDADGLTDLFWRYTAGTGHPHQGENRVWLAAFEAGVLTGTEVGYNVLNSLTWSVDATGDFNDDGLADVIWRNTATGEIVVYLTSFEAGNISVAPGSGYLVTADQNRVSPSPTDYAVVGSAHLATGEGLDLLLRGTGSEGVTWRFRVVGKLVTHALRVPPSKFVSPSFELGAAGDFDGDGLDDLVWHSSSSGEAWLAHSRVPVRGIHFSPNTPAGDFWPRHMTDGPSDPYPLLAEMVRSELQAIRDRTGLRDVHVNFGAGFNLSYPVATDVEMDRVVRFLDIARDEGMRVIMNLGNHCWLPNSALFPANPLSQFRHVGGTQQGTCFAYHVPDDCRDVGGECCIQQGGSCEPGGWRCIRLPWALPTCGDNTESPTAWYSQVLDYLEVHAENLAESIRYINIAGDPLGPFPGEPAVFEQTFFSENEAELSDYFQAVVGSLAERDPGLPVGCKLWLSPEPAYERLENLVAAAGTAIVNLDYVDLTANVQIDPGQVLQHLGFDQTVDGSRVVLSDFKAARPPWTDLDPEQHPLEELFACFFQAIQAYDLGGWWFWQYRDEAHRVGIRANSGGPGPDPPGTSTWKDPSVDAVLRQEGRVGIGLPHMPVCTLPLPYTPD